MCEIKITSVIGIQSPSGELDSIIIEGTVSSCSKIKVVIICGGQAKHKEVQPSSGKFKTVFSKAEASNAECSCGEAIKVVASCVNKRDCFDEWEGTLECKPEDDGDNNGNDDENSDENHCADKSKSLIDCVPPNALPGPQYTLPYHQALPYDKLDIDIGTQIEQNQLKLACISIEENGLEASLAVDLLFHQDWHYQELGINDVVSTISLAPKEQLNLTIKKTQRKLFQQDTLDSVEKLESSESTFIDKDIMNVTRSSSQTENWKIDGNAGIRTNLFNIGISGGYSKSINDTATWSLQRINEATKKSAKSLKSLHKVEVKEQTEQTAEHVTARTISNPYRDRSLTVKVYSLAKRYCIETSLISVSPAILITVNKIDFDRKFVLSNGSFLTEYLLDHDLQVELPTVLEAIVDFRKSENIERAIKMARLSLQYMFEVQNIFNVPKIIGFGSAWGGDPNVPATCFDANEYDISGLEDAIDSGYGILFTTLNFYYKVYKDNVQGKPEEESGTLALDLALSLEKTAGAVWNAGVESKLTKVGDVLDRDNLTEVFRRLGGFLSIISGIVRPLVQYSDQEKEAELAAQKAEIVIDRAIRHLQCHSDYYTEQFLKYVATTTSLLTVRRFVRDALSRIKGNPYLKMEYDNVFDLERVFLNGNQIIVPIRSDKGHEDIKKFTKELAQQDLTGINLGVKNISELEVPFDGIHLEVVSGKCLLTELPSEQSYSVDANLNIKPDK